MMERSFVKQKINEFMIQEYIEQNVKKAGLSRTKLVKTPLGDKIIIYASRPGLVVGKKGENLKKLTLDLKKKFDLENPQIELNEVENIFLDPKIVGERIVNSLERFGAGQFKSIGHKVMEDIMRAGALGVEILISGRGVPGSRAKSWRFYQGYLKKSGDVAISQVKHATTVANLKTGCVGVQVSIMPPDVNLPDRVTLKSKIVAQEVKQESKTPEVEKKVEETKEEPAVKEEKKEEKKKPRKPSAKKSGSSKSKKNESSEAKK